MSTNVQGSVNPRDTSVRYQGIDGEDSTDSWLNYNSVSEADIQKYATFCRAFQARKDQQVKQQQEKEQEIQVVAKY